MSYTVLIGRRQQGELASVPNPARGQVAAAIAALGEHPRPAGCTKLKVPAGWRIRAGDYRILYEIDDTAHSVTILNIAHRRDIYRL